MQRPVLLLVALALAVIAGAAWYSRRDPGVTAMQEAPSLGQAAPAQGPAAVKSTEPTLSEPAPIPKVQPTSDSPPAEIARSAAEAAPPQDFESKYKLKTAEELRSYESELMQQISGAAQARFDELHLQFPQLLAEGRYGAHVIHPGESFSSGGTTRPMSISDRSVITSPGVTETHHLEIFLDEEPATAGLFAERVWIQTRLQQLKQQR